MVKPGTISVLINWHFSVHRKVRRAWARLFGELGSPREAPGIQ